MIEKRVTYDHYINEEGHVHVREITRVMEDGVELSKNYHRHVVTVLDDVDNEDPHTKQIIESLRAGISEEYEAAMEDGVITEEEAQSIWTKFKAWMFS